MTIGVNWLDRERSIGDLRRGGMEPSLLEVDAEPVECISLQKIAAAKLCAEFPELDKERLIFVEMRLGHGSIAIMNTMSAMLFAHLGGRKEQISASYIRGLAAALGEMEEAGNWRVEVLGGAKFWTWTGKKAAARIMTSNAKTGFGDWTLADGIMEIRRKNGGRFWSVHVERNGYASLDGRSARYFVLEKTDVGLLEEYLGFCGKLWEWACTSDGENQVIEVANATGDSYPIRRQDWDEIYMTEEIRRGLRDDFNFFIKNEEWFRRRRLPFKRGYLLVGPPGNGKTTALRAMAATPGFRAYTFDFKRQNCDSNADLFNAFRFATENAPCVFALEDIDRLFSSTAENPVNVTKDALLNCLDGISGRDGVVVVATANHPEDLDEAILKRPGRFDRVIRFALPDAAMRSRILTDLYAAESPSGGLEPDLLAELIDATDGFSMAAMKEFFIASANEAFQAGSACITAEHTREALNILKRQHTHAASGKRIGF